MLEHLFGAMLLMLNAVEGGYPVNEKASLQTVPVCIEDPERRGTVTLAHNDRAVQLRHDFCQEA